MSKIDLKMVGSKDTNQYYPFTREEFFKIVESVSYGKIERLTKEREKQIEELRKLEKKKDI